MKARYRVKEEEELADHHDMSGGAAAMGQRASMNGGGAPMPPKLRASMSTSSHRSSGTNEELGTSTHHRPRRADIEGCPMAGSMVDRQHPPSHNAAAISSEESDPFDEGDNNKFDKQWLTRRASKQDEISSMMNTMKERLEEESMERDRKLHEVNVHDEIDPFGRNMDGDDDQPMSMGSKNTTFKQFKRAINKTADVTKSAAKGSVNVVRDPKRAAKRVGTASKSAAKGTVNIVKDPKLAAKNLGKVTKTMTLGSVKVGAGITMGVTKGTFGATKKVVQGSLNATTTVAVGTVKGAGKVAKGASRAVRGKSGSSKNNVEQNYDATKLADRHSTSLFDRVTQLVETKESDDAILQQALQQVPQPQDPSKPQKVIKLPPRASSILMPTIAVSGDADGSWDV
jgi:hypothetical protein